MRLPRRSLRRSNAGATAIEFALLAPVFLAFLLGLIEVSRLLWTTQVVQRAAHETARCYAIPGDRCGGDAAKAKEFAAAIGREAGIAIPEDGVTAATGVECEGMADQNRVSVTIPFDSVAPKILPVMPSEVSSVACFPIWFEG